MKLQEIFEQLTTGELSQLNIGGSESGAISEDNYRAVMNHINLGLANIFQRFQLKEGRLKVVLFPGVLSYSLDSKYATSTGDASVAHQYLDDAASPFQDDLIKVKAVLTSTGYELGLNDFKDPLACGTPKFNTLTVPASIVAQSPDLPEHLKTDYLNVVYQATHPKLDTSEDADIDPDAIEVDMPYAYLEPLLYFVAMRAYHPVSLNSEVNMGSSYAAKFEQACQRLELNNLEVDQAGGNTRLRRNGWV